MSFQRVARESEIPEGGGLRVVVEGIEVGLFRHGEAIYAMENRCPHAGEPLSEGRLEGCVVACAAHGWRFDVRTGFRPGFEDGFPIPCFPVRREDGAVWIDLARPLNLERPGSGD